jgi:hypothetical protein
VLTANPNGTPHFYKYILEFFALLLNSSEMNLLKKQEIERLEAEISSVRDQYANSLVNNANFAQVKSVYLWLRELEKKLQRAVEKYSGIGSTHTNSTTDNSQGHSSQ